MTRKNKIIIAIAAAAIIGTIVGLACSGGSTKKLRNIADQVCNTQYQEMIVAVQADKANNDIVDFLKSKQDVFCECYRELVVDNASDYDGLEMERLIEMLVLDYAGYTYQCLDTFGTAQE